MKVYLVYESLYGELCDEGDSTLIEGIFDNIEKAKSRAKLLVKADLESGFVLDEEENDIESNDFCRVFYGYQENWTCYYEIFVEEREVE